MKEHIPEMETRLSKESSKRYELARHKFDEIPEKDARKSHLTLKLGDRGKTIAIGLVSSVAECVLGEEGAVLNLTLAGPRGDDGNVFTGELSVCAELNSRPVRLREGLKAIPFEASGLVLLSDRTYTTEDAVNQFMAFFESGLGVTIVMHSPTRARLGEYGLIVECKGGRGAVRQGWLFISPRPPALAPATGRVGVQMELRSGSTFNALYWNQRLPDRFKFLKRMKIYVMDWDESGARVFLELRYLEDMSKRGEGAEHYPSRKIVDTLYPTSYSVQRTKDNVDWVRDDWLVNEIHSLAQEPAKALLSFSEDRRKLTLLLKGPDNDTNLRAGCELRSGGEVEETWDPIRRVRLVMEFPLPIREHPDQYCGVAGHLTEHRYVCVSFTHKDDEEPERMVCAAEVDSDYMMFLSSLDFIMGPPIDRVVIFLKHEGMCDNVIKVVPSNISVRRFDAHGKELPLAGVRGALRQALATPTTRKQLTQERRNPQSTIWRLSVSMLDTPGTKRLEVSAIVEGPKLELSIRDEGVFLRTRHLGHSTEEDVGDGDDDDEDEDSSQSSGPEQSPDTTDTTLRYDSGGPQITTHIDPSDAAYRDGFFVPEPSELRVCFGLNPFNAALWVTKDATGAREPYVPRSVAMEGVHAAQGPRSDWNDAPTLVAAWADPGIRRQVQKRAFSDGGVEWSFRLDFPQGHPSELRSLELQMRFHRDTNGFDF